MKNIKIDENAARLLLVEGPDDEVFFLKLVEHMGISDDIQIFSYGGKDNLRRYLLAILNDLVGLPNALNWVVVKRSVASDDCQVMANSLRDNHAVERISMP